MRPLRSGPALRTAAAAGECGAERPGGPARVLFPFLPGAASLISVSGSNNDEAPRGGGGGRGEAGGVCGGGRTGACGEERPRPAAGLRRPGCGPRPPAGGRARGGGPAAGGGGWGAPTRAASAPPRRVLGAGNGAGGRRWGAGKGPSGSAAELPGPGAGGGPSAAAAAAGGESGSTDRGPPVLPAAYKLTPLVKTYFWVKT